MILRNIKGKTEHGKRDSKTLSLLILKNKFDNQQTLVYSFNRYHMIPYMEENNENIKIRTERVCRH